jgi:hypothetical protein
MHIDSSIIRHLDTNDAHVVRDITYRSVINMQSSVDIEASSHVFRVLVQKMKVDVERIVRRRDADVTS